MRFEGERLQQILRWQHEFVIVLDDKGIEAGRSRPGKACELALMGYFGIGSKRRIRYVRPAEAALARESGDIRRSDRTWRPQLPIAVAAGKGLNWVARFDQAKGGRSGSAHSIFVSSESKASEGGSLR
jgi:hypothetical protein